MRRLARIQTPRGLAVQASRGICLTAQLPRRQWHTEARLRPAAQGVQRPFNTSTGKLQELKSHTAVVDEMDEVDEMELGSKLPLAGELVVPGAVETAPSPDNVGDATYVPAQTGEGLEEVGGLENWWDMDRHWDPALEFRGFGAAQRVMDAAALEVLARQAVLEALAVQASGDGRVTLVEAWSRGGAAARRTALALDVDVAEDGSVKGLRGDAEAVVAGLDAKAMQQDTDEAVLGDEEARELLKLGSAAWKKVSLENPALKFAVAKRILQLTGHLLPDARLATASTIELLLKTLVRPPKAKSLAEELHADGRLEGLSNVAVYERRVTPIDRHKQVGRWKVIVQELEKRGLPVTGTGGYDKSVERRWAFR